MHWARLLSARAQREGVLVTYIHTIISYIGRHTHWNHSNVCLLHRNLLIDFCSRVSGVGRCLILGGPNYFGDIHMYTYACTYRVFLYV